MTKCCWDLKDKLQCKPALTHPNILKVLDLETEVRIGSCGVGHLARSSCRGHARHGNLIMISHSTAQPNSREEAVPAGDKEVCTLFILFPNKSGNLQETPQCRVWAGANH